MPDMPCGIPTKCLFRCPYRGQNGSPTMTKKNILMIVCDQWRGDCIGKLGNTILRTPNLDLLCESGVTFGRHFTQGSPCAPARASMLLGRYAMNHRVIQHGTPWPAEFEGLPQELRRAGYNPAFIGYTSSVPDPRKVPETDPGFFGNGAILGGFDVIRTKEPKFKPYMEYLTAKGYEVSDTIHETWRPAPEAGTKASTLPSRIRAEHSDTAWFMDAGLDYLSGPAQRGENGWFLHLGTWRPHPPFIAPAPYNALYDPRTLPKSHRRETPASEAEQHPMHAYYLGSILQSDFISNGEGLAADMTDEEIAAVRANYYGLLSEVDDHLGRLFEDLKARGEWENTLIIFTGDHGEQLGDHRLLGKMSYFDQSYHIPLVIYDPSPEADATRGTIVDAFTETVDLLPTILKWLDRPIPRWADGRSLTDFVKGDAPENWRKEAHFEFDFRDVVTEDPQDQLGLTQDQCSFAAIRGERFKYVHFAHLAPLLFDMQADPHEMNNLAADPAYRDALLDCAQKMLTWRLEFAARDLTGMSASSAGLISRP